MDVLEVTNGEVEFSYLDKKYKVKRLSLKEIYEDAERVILNEYNKNMMVVQEALKGQEKINFMIAALKAKPSGTELNLMANQWNCSAEGIVPLVSKILNKCQKVSEDEAKTVALDEKYSVLSFAIVNYALSGDIIKDEEKIKEILAGESKKK